MLKTTSPTASCRAVPTAATPRGARSAQQSSGACKGGNREHLPLQNYHWHLNVSLRSNLLTFCPAPKSAHARAVPSSRPPRRLYPAVHNSLFHDKALRHRSLCPGSTSARSRCGPIFHCGLQERGALAWQGPHVHTRVSGAPRDAQGTDPILQPVLVSYGSGITKHSPEGPSRHRQSSRPPPPRPRVALMSFS